MFWPFDEARKDFTDAVEKWLALWRIGWLMIVSPWDDVIRAFAERTELMPRRLAALDLDPNAVAAADPVEFLDLQTRCAACETPERCEWELREDPVNSAWLEYCPNSERLLALRARNIG